MSLQKKVDELNRMILQGEILAAFEKFYADDVVMQDMGSDPREGKDANREFEKTFVNGLTEFRGADLLSTVVDEEEGISMSEWFFDYTHKDWGTQTYQQVAVQRWEDGQIVNERFYHP